MLLLLNNLMKESKKPRAHFNASRSLWAIYPAQQCSAVSPSGLGCNAHTLNISQEHFLLILAGLTDTMQVFYKQQQPVLLFLHSDFLSSVLVLSCFALSRRSNDGPHSGWRFRRWVMVGGN